MNFSIRLDTPSLLKVARKAHARSRGLREKLIQRTTEGKTFAVWEAQYNNPEKTKGLITALRDQFPKSIMSEVLLFVNNGSGDAYQTFVAAGFPDNVFPHVQPILNSVVGFVRNFQLAPEILITMAVQGAFEMESDATPSKVDRAYGGNIPEAS